MINSHNDQKKKVETKILQKLSVLPILCFIYINGVFEQIEKEEGRIVLSSFVDNLEFIVSRILVK